MKKSKIFTETLLISQEEMAILLGISRSQWAMYTNGYRGLSALAKINLGEVLTAAKKATTSERELLVQKNTSETELRDLLAIQLKENQFKQVQLKRKLEQIEAKFQAALNTLHFLEHFTFDKEQQPLVPSVIEQLKTKTTSSLHSNGLVAQELLQIKLETVQHEEKLLRSRLK